MLTIDGTVPPVSCVKYDLSDFNLRDEVLKCTELFKVQRTLVSPIDLEISLARGKMDVI